MTIFKTSYKSVEVNGEIAKDPNDYERLGIPHPESVPLESPINERLQDAPVVGALMGNPTEDNVALAFSARHKNEYIYLHGRGAWFKWDGTRWCRDAVNMIKHDIRNLARAYNSDSKSAPAKSSFVSGVESFLKSDPAFARDASTFDSDNYLLNCPDGTYDLKTMTRRAHNPEDCITYLTSASPDSKVGKRFRQFLDEITDGDKELQAFLQRALGSCLSGAIEEHWLMCWTGPGRNGKNTLGDAVLNVMGDYSRTIPSATLMAQQNPAHATEIMNLKGKRLVSSGEIEEGAYWAEAKIKELTGDEYLNGQYMRQNWMSFRRTHKHLIYGNYRPQLRNTDVGIRSRLKIVPFNVSFLGREDADLPRTLADEAGYILWWMMEGHCAWMEAGKAIGTCKAIDDETQDYYEAQSTIDMWIAERCIVEPLEGQPKSYWARANPLYRDYQTWKRARGEYAQSQTRFGEALTKKHPKVRADGIRYQGLILKY